MNKNISIKILTGIMLALAPTGALAQSALSQLGTESGIETAAIAAQLQAARTADAAPSVTAETAAKLTNVFKDLLVKGFPGVEWQGLRAGARYVRVPLRLATCPGGVSYSAMLPIGAVTLPGSPERDPNQASFFILERSGEWVKPGARYSAHISLTGKDVLAGCSALDAKSFLPWNVNQASLMIQTCLNHAYPADGGYQVRAEAARFGSRLCPNGDGAACRAIVEVVGIKITVSGRILTSDTVLNDLKSTLDQRGNKLMGFETTLENTSN
jgi:hypothetical protein